MSDALTAVRLLVERYESYQRQTPRSFNGEIVSNEVVAAENALLTVVLRDLRFVESALAAIPRPQTEEDQARIDSTRPVPTPDATAGKDCGYQDVECWVRQLRASGWLPVNVRTLEEVDGSNTWRSPKGSL